MTYVLAAEWRKLWSARSTRLVLAVVAVSVGLMALLAWYAANLWDGLPPARRSAMGLAPLPELLEWIASLCFAVLGVISFTGEYGTGMIRLTFTAMPSRQSVLAAKAAVVGALALACGLAAVAATSLLGRWIIGGRTMRGQPTEPFLRELPQLGAMGLSITTFALLGLFAGAIARSTAAAVAVLVAIWYVIPIVANNVPAPWDERLGSVLPGALAGQIAGTGNPYSVGGSLLSPLAALAVNAAYVLVPYGLAAAALTRRDA
ncbi:ABC transporter permease subunit [Microbispora sp. ATCC PTA-5024]|uniref:ABC transporter permease subunit n=1 Tax=Microbispora sp. ATCC PTA-5024 TaxID=316330 RepID=UPI0003DD5F3A|nr:ABC transporter permease subunit [Microbispora sp. ATCC PTA-5024]ETK35179.1 hypothetical protein MPTA5024_15570 [Microbispora sp. ATCC PTA-5024]